MRVSYRRTSRTAYSLISPCHRHPFRMSSYWLLVHIGGNARPHPPATPLLLHDGEVLMFRCPSQPVGSHSHAHELFRDGSDSAFRLSWGSPTMGSSLN